MAQAIRNVPSANFIQKTLNAALLAGVTSAVTLNNVTSIQNLPGVFVVDRVDTNGTETPPKREVVKYAAVSGSTLTTLTRNADGGGTDQDHAVGAIVEFVPDILWAQSIYDALSQIITPSTGLLDTTLVVTPAGAQTVYNKMISGATLSGPSINLGSGATGSLFYDTGNGTLNRIGPGTSSQILTMNASLPAWAAAGAASASLSRSPFIALASSANYSLDFSAGQKFMATVVPSVAIQFLATNATVGDIAMLRVQYASTASFSLALLNGAGATISWPQGNVPIPTATVGKADLFGFEVNATIPKIDGVIIGQNI